MIFLVIHKFIYKGAFPMRFKALHLVNLTFIFRYIFNIAKRFLNEKVAERVGSFYSFEKKCYHNIGYGDI